MNRKLISALILTASIFSLWSCTDDEIFSIGDNLTEIKGDVIQVDTFSINSFTIKADSIQTSGYNMALVGTFTDGPFGKITTSSYFKIALPSSTSLSENAKFDSICMVLKPTGYSYGDTTKPFTIRVHKLYDDLENTDVSSWYNTSRTNYSPEILGSKTSNMKPNSGKELTIKLSDTFGKELFDIFYNEGEETENQENFSEYLKGFALTSGNNTTSIMQFSTADSLEIIKLYYHVGKENYTLDFTIYETSVQYNKIDVEYGDSPLKSLKEKENRIASDVTGNVSYCQAGLGVYTRLEFPYLNKLFETYQAYKILKAELIIKPVKGTYNLVPLTENLNLYSTNTLNDFGSIFSDAQGNTISPSISIDKMYNKASYTFDLTSFIASSIANAKDDPPSLLVSINDNTRNTSLERLILGSSKHPTDAVQLKIVFWKY